MRFVFDSRIDRQNGVLKAKSPMKVGKWPVAFLLAAVLTAFAGSLQAQGIRMNEDIVADPNTGAAIYGFDPVAFFVDRRPLHGESEWQALHAGKVWYFASEANRTAFLANPPAYLPAFGGHDPVAIAAGFAVSGSPEFFAIREGRVFLFRHPESRDAFKQDERIAEMAETNWPQVKRDMIP